MLIDLNALPDDAALLQQMLRTVLLQQSELHAENDKLRLLIQRLTRHQFGRRSEQLSDLPPIKWTLLRPTRPLRFVPTRQVSCIRLPSAGVGDCRTLR